MRLILFFIGLIGLTSAIQWRTTIDAKKNDIAGYKHNSVQLGCSNCVITPPAGKIEFGACVTKCNDNPACVSINWNNGNNVPGAKECILNSQRFGFGGATLQPGGAFVYAEKLLTNLTAAIEMRQQSSDAPSFNSYLVRYREGVQNTKLSGRSITKSNIKTVEECAALCTRNRGQLNAVTGERCNSFNHNAATEQCELMVLFEALSLPSRVDTGNVLHNLAGWVYYERITVPGCWVSDSSCRKLQTTQPRTFQIPNIKYEFECARQARFYHEDVCDSLSSSPTVSWWGGVRGAFGVFEQWNTWDQTRGCVITLQAGTQGCTPVPRFSGTFRDSIGEEDRGAGLVPENCFNRARGWHAACNYSATTPVEAFHATSNRRYSFPISPCSCDGYGVKIDPTTQRRYCTRASNTSCSRNILDLTAYSHPDILCDDLPTTMTGGRLNCQSQLSGPDACFVIPPITCPSGAYAIDSKGYHRVANINSEKECQAAALNIYSNCNNADQVRMFWNKTGKVFVYPEFANAFVESTARVITTSTAFTPPLLDAFGNPFMEYMNVTTGRSMRFTARTTGRVRHIDVWFRTSSDADILNMTIKLFSGPDINGPLLATGWGIAGPNATKGGYIHFAVDTGRSPDTGITRDSVYTWEVTKGSTIASAPNTASPSGYVGYVSGNRYPTGSSDFSDTLDYSFVVWYEFYEYKPAPLKFTVIPKTDSTFKGIWFIVLLIIYLIFACILCFLHRRRLKEEEKERAQNRRMREQSTYESTDASRTSLAGGPVATSGGPQRKLIQVPSVAPSEEHSNEDLTTELLSSSTTPGEAPNKQRAYV